MIIGGMASIGARKGGLRKVLNTLNNQKVPFDRIFLYCNDWDGYEDRGCVSFLAHPDGDLGASAKVRSLVGARGYLFMLDDDILYPDDFTARMIDAADRGGIWGVRGANVPDSFTRYWDERVVVGDKPPWDENVVDILNTNSVCWRGDNFNVSMPYTPNMVDLHLARQAREQGVEMRVLSRDRKHWILQLPHRDTLYSRRGDGADEAMVYKHQAGKYRSEETP